MNILIFDDIHYSIIDKIKLVNNFNYDIVFCLGDIDCEHLVAIKQVIGDKPIYGILGNHDDEDTLLKAGIKNIHGKVIEFAGITFIGFQGSHDYKYCGGVESGFIMYSEDASIAEIEKFKKADVLLSHDSYYHAYSTEECHCGLKGIDRYLKNSKCKLHIHGHYHFNNIQQYKYGLFKQIPSICTYMCNILNTDTCELTEICLDSR